MPVRKRRKMNDLTIAPPSSNSAVRYDFNHLAATPSSTGRKCRMSASSPSAVPSTTTVPAVPPPASKHHSHQSLCSTSVRRHRSGKQVTLKRSLPSMLLSTAATLQDSSFASDCSDLACSPKHPSKSSDCLAYSDHDEHCHHYRHQWLNSDSEDYPLFPPYPNHQQQQKQTQLHHHQLPESLVAIKDANHSLQVASRLLDELVDSKCQSLLSSASPAVTKPIDPPFLIQLVQNDVIQQTWWHLFDQLTENEKTSLLLRCIDRCSKKQLSALANSIMPRLKIDIARHVPHEIAVEILAYLPVKSLCRLARTSRYHAALVNDNVLWRIMCERYRYINESDPSPFPRSMSYNNIHRHIPSQPNWKQHISSSRDICPSKILNDRSSHSSFVHRRHSDPVFSPSAPIPSYKLLFQRHYTIHTNWRDGNCTRYTVQGPESAIITSLQFNEHILVIGTDNSDYGYVEVFDSRNGFGRRSFIGHEGGVWALEFLGQTLVSGGCDRDLRVWNLDTGECRLRLPGHTSTIRCLKMLDEQTVLTGSRDNTVRLWNIGKGECEHVFRGHTGSIRCLATHGPKAVSGSYDYTIRVWDLDAKECLHVLDDHHAQIYSIAFDGRYVCSGSLDADVRVWDADLGQCLWVLEGHDALVGHMQLRNKTLVTGGSDGRICIWNLENGQMMRRINAHRNSVSTLQFDDNRILSGGEDGVKIWNTTTGEYIRTVVKNVTGIWRLQFTESRMVIASQVSEATSIEIMDFDTSLPPASIKASPFMNPSSTCLSSLLPAPDQSLLTF